MHRPRILFVNRSYWPDSEATGQLLTELCEALADSFEVHVLVGAPNATIGTADWQGVEHRNGVQIHRVSHTRFSKGSLPLKAFNFISFAVACRRRILQLPTPDVVVFETDPFLLPFVADRLHRKANVKMVGYLQDVYPDIAVALGKIKDRRWVRWLRSKMFGVYSRCEAMVVLSEDMKALLTGGGINPRQVEVIPNWADSEAIKPVEGENQFRADNGFREKFLIMYSGNLGLTQRLEDFVLAAKELSFDPDIAFAFIGRGARKSELQDMVAKLGLSNVSFFDYQPRSELCQSLSAADLHLIPLTAELSKCLMPSKLYGVLAAGSPYLTNALPGSDLHRITVENEVGLTIPPSDIPAIVKAISELKANPQCQSRMRKNARQVAVTRFTKEKSILQFRGLLQRLTSVSEV
ncbi:MAG: glycosyltransferase family 4 protein [Fuerstiella sp.]